MEIPLSSTPYGSKGLRDAEDDPAVPPQDDAFYTREKMLRSERLYVEDRHRALGIDNHDFGIGVCLSGGGMRAAAFGLGVMRVLKDAKLLPHVDYLSSVSGGGYTATAWAAQLLVDTGGTPWEHVSLSEGIEDSLDRVAQRMRSSADVYIKGFCNVLLAPFFVLLQPVIGLVQSVIWGFIVAEFMGCMVPGIVYNLTVVPTFWWNLTTLWQAILVVGGLLLLWQPFIQCATSPYFASLFQALQCGSRLVCYTGVYLLLVTYTGGIFLAMECQYKVVTLNHNTTHSFSEFCSRQQRSNWEELTWFSLFLVLWLMLAGARNGVRLRNKRVRMWVS